MILYKRILQLLGAALLIFLSSSLLQEYYLTKKDILLFPVTADYLPDCFKTLAAAPQTEAITVQKIDDDTNIHDAILLQGSQQQALRNFFAALEQLEQKKRKKVRILSFSDSINWGERVTDPLRRGLQKQFGDGGRGLIPIVNTASYKLTGVKNYTKQSQFHNELLRFNFRKDGEFASYLPIEDKRGFLGNTYTPLQDKSFISFRADGTEHPWSSLHLFLRNNSDKIASYQITPNSGNTEVIILSPGSLKEFSSNFKESRSFDLHISGRPSIDALLLERDEGVVFNSVIHMGTHMSWLAAVDHQVLSRGLSQLDPDLIILHYGGNETESLKRVKGFTKKDLRLQVQNYFTLLKKILPKTDILLIGLHELLVKKNGAAVTADEMLTVRSIMRDESQKIGAAYFDSYLYLGGSGHLLPMVKSGEALSDYIHLTTKGGNRLGQGLFNKLMSAYDSYSGKITEKSDLEKDDMHKPTSDSSAAAIQFNSRAYAYFLGIVIILSILLSGYPRLRIIILTGASYYFYMSWIKWPVLLLVGSTIVDYACGAAIGYYKKRGARGTLFLIISLIANLGLLLFFKYYNFFAKQTSLLLSSAGFTIQPYLLHVLLPVGISFYTFQTLSYTIDVWRGKITVEKSFWKFALFVSFFPQLVAGPIVRAKEFLPGLNKRMVHFQVNYNYITQGLFLIFTGLLKKMSADWLAVNLVDRVFTNPEMFSSVEAAASVYGYALQIYGDFSGYSDIAIGSALLLGYNLTENFNRPYKSRSISEFWKRWHISLGSWFRDYLYIPLGGNRKHVYLTLLIVMFICGLWHGAGLSFIIWGLYHGAFLMGERLFGLHRKTFHPAIEAVRVIISFHIVLFGWIIFRAADWNVFMNFMHVLTSLNFSFANLDSTLILVMLLLYGVHFSPKNFRKRVEAFWMQLNPLLQGSSLGVLTLFLYSIAVSDVKPFIYFQF